MFPYWTLMKYGIPFIIGAVIFGGSAWKIQSIRLDNAKAAVVVCEQANSENTKTIELMKVEIEKNSLSCSKKLAGKDATINRLRQIDSLEVKGEKVVDSGDAILDELNRMW